MGLDVTAYSRLSHVGRHVQDWCDDADHIQAHAYTAFPQSFRGIPVRGTRPARDGDVFFVGGCYVTTADTATHSFKAGAYSGYGRWRDDLRDQFNPRREQDLPFYELIWFADNEGSIGPLAAADLLVDFNEHASRYRPPWHSIYGNYYQERYEDWTKACRLAADGGLIHFG